MTEKGSKCCLNNFFPEFENAFGLKLPAVDWHLTWDKLVLQVIGKLRWPKVANHNSKFDQQQKQIRNQQKQIKNQQKQTKNQQKQMNYQQQKQMRSRKNSIMNLFLLPARLLLLLLGSTSNQATEVHGCHQSHLVGGRPEQPFSTTPNQHSLKVPLITPDFSDCLLYLGGPAHRDGNRTPWW